MSSLSRYPDLISCEKLKNEISPCFVVFWNLLSLIINFDFKLYMLPNNVM
ncbi:hypothetical protein ACE6H2_000153 [Prunus campanulata]